MVLEFTSKNDTGNGASPAIPREILDAVSIMGDKPKSPAVTITNENEKTKTAAAISTKSPFLDSSPEEKKAVTSTATVSLSVASASAASSDGPTSTPLTAEPVKVTVSAPVAPLPVPVVLPAQSNSSPYQREAVTLSKEPAPLVPQQTSITNKALPVDDRLHFASSDLADSVKKSHAWLYWLIAGTALFTAAGVGWYFFRAKLPFFTAPSAVLEPAPLIVPAPLQSTKQLPFSLDKANYLLLDTESATPESIKQVLDQAGKTLMQAEIAAPVEFLLTDKNNNPLAFSRLAYLEKIALPADLLSALDEPFSVFLYSDQGMIRIGLMLTLKDAASGGALIKNNEATLPLSFQNLFYGNVVAPRKAVFRTGVYGAQAIRYVNIVLDKNISFDYVLEEKQWLIGNSKDTVRVLLDKKH